jgi:mannitol/fructose-specific phosphotransferase system IIA component (Ntr-type)
MFKVIHELIQLQDLIFAREQHDASMPGARFAQLDASIQTMISDLPEDVSAHFMKMNKKGILGIVPLSNGSCSGCGMVLPVSQYHAVRAADHLHRCSSCARFLYEPASPLRRVSRKRPRGEPPPAGMARFSSPALMIPQLEAADRDAALAEIAARMESEGFVNSADRLTEEALRREAIVSTAVDHGLAFPHVRGVEGGGLTLALGLSRKGIKFGGPAKTLSKIIFFIVIPSAASAFYLKVLSGLTQTFSDADARDALMEAESQAELWKALVKATRATIP